MKKDEGLGNRLAFTVNGTAYRNLRDACERLGLPYVSVQEYKGRHRLSSEEVVARYAAGAVGKWAFTVHGTAYRDLGDACRRLGLNYKVLRAYKERHRCSSEEAVLRYVDGVASYGGKAYRTRREACKDLGVSLRAVYGEEKRRGVAFNEALRAVMERGGAPPMQRMVSYGGVAYANRKEACAALGVPYGAVQDAMRRLGMDFPAAVDAAASRPSREVVFRGERYPSRAACHRAFGVCGGSVYQRMRQAGISWEASMEASVAKRDAAKGK